MENWRHEHPENHVIVKFKENESILVKVSSETNVSQVLTRVCEKWNLDPEKHYLKYYTEYLLDSDRNIASTIPPNSTLHVTESKTEEGFSFDDDMVYVSMQMDSTVLRKPFQQTASVSHVLNELHNACSQTFPRKEANKQKQKGTSSKILNSKCRIILEKNEKLLILIPSGTITLEPCQFDSTRLCDFDHDGHIFITFMIEDLEDVPLLEDDQDEVLHSSQDESSQAFYNVDRDDLLEEESQPSVAKIKQMLETTENQKSEEKLVLLLTEKPIPEKELFDRFGLIYRMDSDTSSSSDLLQIKTEEELSGVFTQSWISICFQDNLAIQASFAPFEYVQDIKSYVKDFLLDPSGDFNLTYVSGGDALDEKDSIFSSGLVPSAKLHFVQVYAENDEVSEYRSQDNISSDTIINGLDPKFTTRVVTESVAAATAISFSRTLDDITIESESYRPMSEETTWEKVKVSNN